MIRQYLKDRGFMKTNKYISMLLLMLAAVFWGFAFVAQDLVSEIGPMSVGMMRWAIGAVFLFSMIPLCDRVQKNGRRLFDAGNINFKRDELLGGLITGVVLSLASVLQQAGINYGTTGGKAAFITALYVVLVPIYALFLKKKAKLNVWIAVIIAVTGFYFLCIRPGEGIVASDIWVIFSATVYPIHILAIDHFAPKCDSVRMSCIQFFVAFVINAIGALAFESPIAWFGIGANILPFLYLGIFSSGISYTLQVIGQKNVNPTVASLILSLESVFGLVGSVIILGDKLEIKEYIGAGMIFSAVVVSQLEFKSKSK